MLVIPPCHSEVSGSCIVYIYIYDLWLYINVKKYVGSSSSLASIKKNCPVKQIPPPPLIFLTEQVPNMAACSKLWENLGFSSRATSKMARKIYRHRFSKRVVRLNTRKWTIIFTFLILAHMYSFYCRMVALTSICMKQIVQDITIVHVLITYHFWCLF